MLLHWLWLAERPGISDMVKNSLLRQVSSPEELFSYGKEELSRLEALGLTQEGLESLMDKDLGRASKVMERCLGQGIRILTQGDPEYPRRLEALGDPPLLLYYKGTLPEFDELPAIGVVGTRRAGIYGLRTARRLGQEIAQGGGVVVSGLAEGIDAAAMSGALDQGGWAVGVLGCGADIVYPRSNRTLFEKTERQGCILTQYAPGTPPIRWNFPKRNRIISGLSCGVVVVEAPEKSGALSTARAAADQGREVFVVPGSVDDAGFTGSNRLLRGGAIAVSCGQDILAEYEGLYGGKLSRISPVFQCPKPEKAPENSQPKKKLTHKGIDKAAKPPYSDGGSPMPELSEEERLVVEAVGPGERNLDDVIAQAGLPAGKALSILTMLELKGIVSRGAGKRVSRMR